MQGRFIRQAADYHRAAGNDVEAKDRIRGWLADIFDQLNMLLPLWHTATEYGSRDIYREYPRWVLLKLDNLRGLLRTH